MSWPKLSGRGGTPPHVVGGGVINCPVVFTLGYGRGILRQDYSPRRVNWFLQQTLMNIFKNQTKYPGDGKHTRLNKWLEVVGKDKEFLFGSVNGRSRLLKLSLPLRMKDVNDGQFFTCGFFYTSILHCCAGWMS